MKPDLVLRNGLVIDGSGGPATVADVAINGGRIVEVGRVGDRGAQEVDIGGLAVSPGFIDVHTHYDTQVFWDGALTPSPLHGITTALAGNCGFTVAPMEDDAIDYLSRMLSRVEGMPLQALQAGVPWGSWRSMSEYLGALEGTVGVNVGFSVGHSTLRRLVMSDDATQREATSAEVDAMVALLHDGLSAGGLGFTSSRNVGHTDGDGRPVPSRFAGSDELVRLAAACAPHTGTSLEMVPEGWLFSDEEKELMTRMSVAAQRPMNWNVIHANAANLDRHLTNMELGDFARERGGKIVALSQPIEFASRYSFLTPFVLDSLPGWDVPMALPPSERLEVLENPQRRAEMEASARTTQQYQPVVDWGAKVIAETYHPTNKRYEGRLVSDIADELGCSPFDALLDIVCRDELKTTFTKIAPVYTAADWEACRRVWTDPRVLIGGSDAGAHLDFMANFHYTTYVLGTAVRRQQVLDLEQAVKMLTADAAELYGLRERGQIRVGWHADLAVFDPSTIDYEPISTRWDLPGGGGRLYAESMGVEHVFVGGTAIVSGGELTEARPGAVLRSGRDTSTPSLR